MAEQNAVATQQGTQLSVAAQVKSMISQDAVKKKFTEVLGQKAPQFLASITNVVAGSAQLKKCPATTIMSAAFVAATYDLPIDSNLGFAAIVPYNNNKHNQQTRQWEKHPEAQFQMMYKGFIQLAIRSGYYEKMNCSVVYKDELVSYNPITGEVEFVTDFSKCTQRAEGKSENIAGYYAWFKLLTGFRKELFRKQQRLESSRDNEPCITDKKMAGQACLKPVIFLSVYIGRMPETGCMRSMRRFTAHCWSEAETKSHCE